MRRRTLPTVTPLQFVFLDMLTDGFLTGKQLRAKLERSRACRSPIGFYRVVQRLKKAGLITARPITRDRGEYRGAQGLYQLTDGGRDVVAATRRFYGKAARRSRRRRWRRKRRKRDMRHRGQLGCSQCSNQSAERTSSRP